MTNNDSYTETVTTGWFGRIKDALIGLIIGPLLVLAAICLLWWNEGRTVRNTTAYREGKRAVVSVPADRVEASNNGKLVHVTGRPTINSALVDDDFDVEANALLLQREVEMYQWVEDESSESTKNLGGSETTKTTYKYKKEWSSRLHDSSDFHQPEGHQNPNKFKFEERTVLADDATLGAFRLSSSVITEIGQKETLTVSEDLVDDDGEVVASVVDGKYYIGEDAESPKIGDLRISYYVVAPTELSVVAAQQGNDLSSYTASNGVTFALAKSGIHTSDALFEEAQNENLLMAMLLRLGGFLLAFMGFAVAFKIASVLGDVVPILGSIIGFGTGLLALVLALAVSLLTIAVAWLAYRPLLAISLIAVTVALFVMLRRNKKKSAAAVAQAQAVPQV